MNAQQSVSELHADLSEQERAAWISGDIEKAALLAARIDEADELTRLRAMYWNLRECFPIHSSTRKPDLLQKVSAMCDAINEAGEIGDA